MIDIGKTAAPTVDRDSNDLKEGATCTATPTS
jgi:hypothetical protein